jgi:hypothetical protein
MTPNSSLIKDMLHNSVAEGIYNEISNRTSRYYYFLGKTLTWEDDENPPFPTDSFAYELSTRNEIITMKEIKPTDVAFVIPRINWQPNFVYDMYDDQYSTEVQGINLISGGEGYGSAPNVYIGTAGSVAWESSKVVFAGEFYRVNNGNGGFRYYIVGISGTTGTSAPTHTDGTAFNGSAQLTFVNVTDGNGSGASAVATVLDGKVIDIELTTRGSGYTTTPSVIIAGGGGSGSIGAAVLTISIDGAQKLEDTKFYVVTDEFNVYKCLDNNNGAISGFKPIGTTVDPVTFPDGYMWKFLYNIPIALRTKFLTDEYMPVINALRNQFYSNGTIQTVRVDQAGTGYNSGSIIVQGDGYLESDPLYLSGVVIESGGSGYTTANINIDPPFSNVSSWLPTTTLFLGQRLSFNNNIYEIVIAGVSGSVGPVHKVGIANNGTCALRYIGTTATGAAQLTSGVLTGVSLFGMVREVLISDNGFGYTSPPQVTFIGDGIGATGIAVLANSSVSKVIITDPGQNYTTAPQVIFGVAWVANTAVTVGTQLFVSNRLYTVTVAGTTGSVAPSHLSGTATNGTATLQFVGSPADGTAPLKFGSGYSLLPTINITGIGGTGASAYFSAVKSEAKLIPIFANDKLGVEWKSNTLYSKSQKVWFNDNLYVVALGGTSSSSPPTHTSGIVANGTAQFQYNSTFGQLVDVQIDDGGVGYTFATLNVNGDGSNAEISADLSPGDVNTLQANIELLTLDGRLMSIPIISGGWGYAAATVTIEGDGVGAEAVAVLENGAVKKINITNYGQGYRWAKVTITGNGFGAKARAVITPYGGHGKFTINGLFARTLMFYTNISGDKNQGFDVNNDYRQLGILKNPRKYNSTNGLTSIAASACWVISGNISTTFFPADSIVFEAATGRRFRIVTNNGSAILAQSLDNFEPSIGTTFVNEGNFTFTANAVTPPTADKYSGDILFIDNKQAFTPTTDQSVTLRTVIRF